MPIGYDLTAFARRFYNPKVITLVRAAAEQPHSAGGARTGWPPLRTGGKGTENLFMTSQGIEYLQESEAIARIVETVKLADRGTAPFALVLGSGFSHGLVPTTRELVEESLPLWIKALHDHQPFEQIRQCPSDQRTAIAKEFWAEFVKKNTKEGLNLQLDEHTGLPKEAL
jgi:hypothetical protein